eukprot:jgi/Mesen1/9426/ME000618S08828
MSMCRYGIFLSFAASVLIMTIFIYLCLPFDSTWRNRIGEKAAAADRDIELRTGTQPPRDNVYEDGCSQAMVYPLRQGRPAAAKRRSCQVAPFQVTIHAVMDAWALAGNLNEADVVLARLQALAISPNFAAGIWPDAISFDSLIDAYARCEDADGALASWQAMRVACIPPDVARGGVHFNADSARTNTPHMRQQTGMALLSATWRGSYGAA